MLKVFVFVFLVANSLVAADVRWNFVNASGSSNELYLSCYLDRTFALGLWIESSIVASGCRIQDTGTVANFSGNIMQSYSGNVVSESTIRHRQMDDYLNHSWIDDGTVGGTHELYVNKDDDFYLMFVVCDGISGPGLNYVYGWVNIGVEANGNLTLLGSAVDLAGGPMIVGGGGAIPEPSSGLLLLLGWAALGLRRK